MICYMSFTLMVLDHTEKCLCFSSSPLYCHLLFTKGRQTDKEADAEEKKKWSYKIGATLQRVL